MQLLPDNEVPSLQIETLSDGIWDLQQADPEHFTLVVFYRGLHCPVCKTYLKELDARRADFESKGVEVIAISADSKERAQQSQQEWGIKGLKIGFEFPVEKAEEWGLFVSDKLEESEKKDVPEPQQFIEPGLFLVDKEGMLYASSVQSMPFARPPVEELLQAIAFIEKEHYPARGQAVAA